jgi:hypothetical protein
MMNDHFDNHHVGCRLLALTAVLAVGALAACGEDDNDTPAAVAADAASTTTAAQPTASPNDPYCAIERQIDAHFVDAFDALGEEPTEDQMAQAAQNASSAVVQDGLIERATAIAPEALTEDIALLTTAVRLAADGDVSGFMTPESDAAGARVDAYCGLED